VALTLVTAPAKSPVGLAEAKSWARIETGDEDALILGLIEAARGYLGDLDGYTGLAFITQTFDYSLDAFPACGFTLPRWPVQSVASITYIDSAGASQTLSALAYQVDTKSMPARIAPAYGTTWPSTRTILNAVTVRFVAGYGDDPGDVPAPLRAAIMALVAHWYENREPVNIGNITTPLPWHVAQLVAPHRLTTGVG
jgi:uncharacterized phiE125 gp8 family phage protein